MADLTANASLRFKGEIVSAKRTVDTAAARTWYRGQPFIIDQDVDATGNVVQYVDAVVVAATDVFVGIALESGSVLISAAENKEVELAVEPSIVGFKSAVFTAGADEGKTVYMSDSGVLSTTAADNPQIGILDSVEDGYAYIRLRTPQICTGA